MIEMKSAKEIIELPQGWVCIGCGDEYLKDITGEFVADYTEGTMCKKCNKDDEDEGILVKTWEME